MSSHYPGYRLVYIILINNITCDIGMTTKIFHVQYRMRSKLDSGVWSLGVERSRRQHLYSVWRLVSQKNPTPFCQKLDFHARP